MKTTSTQNIKNLLSNFDMQLVNILKEDLRRQQQKVNTTLINMATRTYDNQLLAIVKADIQKLKQAINNTQNDLAQAG
ncbi:hypothetical protein [Pedobacter arcticus]|uniref:hypothetical protein n=1 Tax=Pedobacter arcticus TaxID=752140 RepID=UPI0002EF5F8B|nr:hypothetical protein [Pedobacter arcticus]